MISFFRCCMVSTPLWKCNRFLPEVSAFLTTHTAHLALSWGSSLICGNAYAWMISCPSFTDLGQVMVREYSLSLHRLAGFCRISRKVLSSSWTHLGTAEWFIVPRSWTILFVKLCQAWVLLSGNMLCPKLATWEYLLQLCTPPWNDRGCFSNKNSIDNVSRYHNAWDCADIFVKAAV